MCQFEKWGRIQLYHNKGFVYSILVIISGGGSRLRTPY